jgi:hypothetical protein
MLRDLERIARLKAGSLQFSLIKCYSRRVPSSIFLKISKFEATNVQKVKLKARQKVM